MTLLSVLFSRGLSVSVRPHLGTRAGSGRAGRCAAGVPGCSVRPLLPLLHVFPARHRCAGAAHVAVQGRAAQARRRRLRRPSHGGGWSPDNSRYGWKGHPRQQALQMHQVRSVVPSGPVAAAPPLEVRPVAPYAVPAVRRHLLPRRQPQRPHALRAQEGQQESTGEHQGAGGLKVDGW